MMNSSSSGCPKSLPYMAESYYAITFGKPMNFLGLTIPVHLITHTQFSSAAQLEHMSIASSDTDPTCPKLKNDASSPLLQAKSFSTLRKF